MRLLIRVDASTQMGTGHLMRCLALAQAWIAQRGPVQFAIALPVPALEARLRSEQMQVVYVTSAAGSLADAAETIQLAQEFQADWLVLDGYHFEASYQKTIKTAGLKLLLLDDFGHADHYYADRVLNQNISASDDLYRNREPHTELLLGTSYTLLRREFWPWRNWQRSISVVGQKVLVTLGGGDPDNVTLRVVQALQKIPQPLDIVVVVGGSNPYLAQLQQVIQQSRWPIQLQQNVINMPDLMVWADLAIAAGGTTSWELAFLGLPSLMFILAENQRSIAERLGAMGLVVNLGQPGAHMEATLAASVLDLLQSDSTRLAMSRRSQQLVDGEGITRVLGSMQCSGHRGIVLAPSESRAVQPLHLRSVGEEDGGQLWRWANDPVVRQAAFSSDPIPWEDHCRWFARKLQDPGCYLYIALDPQGQPVGQIRFDQIAANQAEIDVSIDPTKRGMGYGSQLIQLGVAHLFSSTAIVSVYALIKPDNQASIRAFSAAGFILDATILQEHGALKYVKSKQDI